ncbi:hypothetical protein EVU94_10285 [Flavobacteriaceae bacterium 144Ye]|nr:hypothetical protein EVU94_10285 [Flavobacteriaceae bacterium 144Ye]
MKSILILVLALFSFSIQAQDTVKEGDVLRIGKASGETYSHVDFPRLNTLVKRGSVASYKNVVGELAVVESVTKNKDNTVKITMKLKSGKKFFNYLNSVSADFDKAIASGELKQAAY